MIMYGSTTAGWDTAPSNPGGTGQRLHSGRWQRERLRGRRKKRQARPYAVISATFGLRQCIHRADALEAAQEWIEKRRRSSDYGGDCGYWIEFNGERV